jgi:cation diffusion facilitator CzcD-associated flavoprotein CzcO
MSEQEFDVLIVGAGISGVGMACHLSDKLPGKKVAILERRARMGGTWDLFKYPGIRSDSDMFTFGYNFRPWTETKTLADGESIRQYVVDTAEEYNVNDHVHYNQKVLKCSWSSDSKRWTVTTLNEDSNEEQTRVCKFFVMASGYYNYDKRYTPDFEGIDDFKGQVIHPQQWPEGLDYAGKKVVVIGSGATAITLVPTMAGTAEHVTMLQRSPTYIASMPARDGLLENLKKWLPEKWVWRIARWKNVRLQRYSYLLSMRYPNFMRKVILGGVKKWTKGAADMRHFTPSYNPWDERLCVVPDGDLFKALHKGTASIVTDHIETFTETGIKLKSGESLEADIVVTATGLNLEMLGGVEIEVDGVIRQPNEVMSYKAVLIQDAPNMAAIFGYTNASWTLKVDVAAAFVCRLLEYMDDKGYQAAVPRDYEDNAIANASAMDSLKSGYVKRGGDRIPRQGKKYPWKVLNHYRRDSEILEKKPIDDGILELS